jgi:hypothetical protein
MESKKIIPDNISSGGLIGGILGAVLSTRYHNQDDKVIHKAAKTGIFASLGYLAGSFIEKLFRSRVTK